MGGFPYTNAAWDEDSAFITPVSFLVAWENPNWLGRSLGLSSEQSFYVLSSLCFQQSLIKAARLGKVIRSASYLNTQPTFAVSFSQALIPFSWVGTPQYIFQLGWGAGTCYTLQIKLRIINQYRRSENWERLIWIRLDSAGRQPGTRGLYWYQGSNSW